MSATDRALEAAREVGFDVAGIAPCAPPPDAARFEAWLAAGHHAGMGYLAAERERILDPRRVLPAGRSIVLVGFAHSRPAFELAGGGRIARYAVGRDYHNVVGEKLLKLARILKREGWIRDRRRLVDAGPLLERSHQASGQVFMTCTEENWPRELGRRLQRWEVTAGSLKPLAAD